MAASQEKVEFWQGHVKCFENLDISQVAYAKLKNISYDQFKYWYHRFLKSKTKPIKAQGVKPSFKELHFSNNSPSKVYDLELKLHNGNSLSFSSSVANDKLKFVIDTLEGL